MQFVDAESKLSSSLGSLVSGLVLNSMVPRHYEQLLNSCPAAATWFVDVCRVGLGLSRMRQEPQ